MKIPMTDDLQQALQAIIQADPLQRTTFGQGSFGLECRHCGGTDYLGGGVRHTDDCIWVAARAARFKREMRGIRRFRWFAG